VSFIDDFSKFTWIFLLRHKSEVFQHFHDFQHLVERLFNRKIVAMQTDWGGEYQRLNSFFQRIGITHHVSCPHAHQQNGSAERKHRHIVEVGLSLLAHAAMPLKFWDEAFVTAVHLINRLPSRVIQNETPFQRLFSSDPDYTSLRVFGCACWPNLRPYNTRKLAFRSTQCVFLGYSPLHKGYKCLEIKTGRVYISRDVIFDETQFPFSKLHPNAGARLRTEISLLPQSLLNPVRGADTFDSTDDSSPNATHEVPDVFPVQDVSRLGASPSFPVENRRDFMSSRPPSAPAACRDSGADPPAPAARESASDPGPGGAAPSASSPSASVAPPPTPGALSAAHPSPPPHTSTCRASTGVPPAPTAPGPLQGGAGVSASTPEPGGGSATGDGGSAAGDGGSSAAAPQHPVTRLQHGIRKPKIYTDGTIRYANLAMVTEPKNLVDALHNPNWKAAMDVEFGALQKNKTWHLVPPQRGKCH
jgi:hypothetical protein